MAHNIVAQIDWLILQRDAARARQTESISLRKVVVWVLILCLCFLFWAGVIVGSYVAFDWFSALLTQLFGG